MIFKRSYEVSLVPCGHPLFNPNGQRCEIIVRDGEDCALIYQDICKRGDITHFLEMLDSLSFGTLDKMTRFWDIKRARAQGTLFYADNEEHILETFRNFDMAASDLSKALSIFYARSIWGMGK